MPAANRPAAITALPADLQSSADNLINMVINGECSFAFVISWAERALTGTARDSYVTYVRTF
jgi:hypothetical protein